MERRTCRDYEDKVHLHIRDAEAGIGGTKLSDPATAETPLYGDEEAERASGVPLPSLRVLQAAGTIRSHKVAKEHGG
jgi:hypothetical protein